jgi:amino acid transporter
MATVDKPSVEEPIVLAKLGEDPDKMQHLKRGAVGLGAVCFMALATAAPITAMTGNVPIAVGYGNGIHAPAGFLVATVILTIFVVGYAAMSRHITATGSFYGYISHGLGQGAGMVSGLLGTVAYMVFEGSLIGIFASFFRSTVLYFFHGPSWVAQTNSWIYFALFGIAVIAIMGYFDIEISGRVLGIFLVTEVAILLILGFSVLFKGGGPSGLVPGALNPTKAFTAAPSGGGVVAAAGIGLFFAFWSWVGFETVAVYGEESKNPKKIVPRALFVCVIAVGVIYTFISWMAVAGNGPVHVLDIARSANPFNMFFGITRSFVGVWAEDIYRVLIITGSFACALAFHNTASRYIYALGREAPNKALRSSFGATHSKHKSPHIASMTQSAFTLVIVLVFFWLQKPSTTAPDVAYDYVYGLLAILGTMIVLILQSLTCFSVIGYFHVRKQHPETANLWRTMLAPLLGAAGMIYVIYLLFKNLDFAAGAAASSPFFKAIPWIVLAVAVIGIAYALLLRKTQPEIYV